MNSKRTRKRYNKNTKIIIIMVLMIGVIGLSIGFSAFSKNLDINSTATVTPDPSDFKVLFSSQQDKVVDGAINIVNNSEGTSGTAATIDNTDPTHPKITGAKVTLPNPSARAEYRFYVINQGKYTAYLKKIEFGTKTCTAKPGTSQDLVNEACKNISACIQFDNDLARICANKAVSNYPLEKGDSVKIWLVISYPSGAPLADGDFDVEFGDITITYSSTDS